MNVHSPRNMPPLRQSNILDQPKNKDLISIECQRDKYFELSIKLKQENQQLLSTTKQLSSEEEKLKKKLQQLRKKVDHEQKKNGLQIIRLKKELDKEKTISRYADKENLHYIHNFESELEYVKGLLRKSQEEQEPRLQFLADSVQNKKKELLLLKKELTSLNTR